MLAALIFILVVWAIAAGIVLCVSLLVSLDEMGFLVRAALLSSAPAMWLVPAFLLIGAPSPVAAVIGFLLVANTIRVFLWRGWPHRNDPSDPPHAGRRKTSRMFSYIRSSPALKNATTTFIFGALALQIGIGMAWAGYGLASAALAAAGAMAWTLAAIARGARLRQPAGSALSAILTLILTVAASMSQIPAGAREGRPATLPQITASTVSQIIHTRPLVDDSTRKRVKNVIPAAKVVPLSRVTLVEGVTLRPEIVRPKRQVSVWPRAGKMTPASQQRFPFSGEYHLFPASVKGVSKNWSVEAGTPVDSIYVTVSGRRLQTEAYQTLDPPVDFTAYRAIQIMLVSHEEFAAAATVQLVGERAVPDLGPEIFGLERTPEETIEFAVPDSLRGLHATGIRIVFSCMEGVCSQSIRVAVKGFNFIPAGR